MKGRDFRRAFGNADAGFARRIDETLGQLLKEEEKPVKKLCIGVAALIAATLLLAAAAFAAANHWGLFDFIGRVSGVSVLPEATDLVETGVVQTGGETEYATFSLREAVYDGQQAYLLFDIVSKKGVLLLGVDSDPEYSMRDLTGKESDATIGEYAAANGLKMVYTNIGLDFENGSTMDFHMEGDGTLAYIVKGTPSQAGADVLEMSAKCITFPSDYADYEKDVRRAELTFALNKAATLAVGESSGAADFPSCGVRVDSIELNATPMGLYYKLRYTVIDQKAFDAVEDGLWFEFLDESGEPMDSGASGSGSVAEIEGGYIQDSSLAAVKEIPSTLKLRAYSAWTKDRYEVAEIAIEAK